jgi:hypothetical protein
MAISKGLKSLAESSPNFSNQALENAVNELKIGWVSKSIQLDTVITNNSVLTTSQKNDLKDTINNRAHVNAGKFLNDMIRHTNSILDGSIIPGNPEILTDDNGQGTFLEILQLTQSLQTLIPDLYGVSAKDKGRSVEDHLGILNNKFLRTDDSSMPVFTSLKEAITRIHEFNTAENVTYQNAIDDLISFIGTLVADSTDFQQSLNNRASAVASAAVAFDDDMNNYPYKPFRDNMVTARNAIVTQLEKEKSNCSTLRSFTETQTDNLAYVGLAENDKLREVMATVAQNTNWKTYFENYVSNQSGINPIYNIDTDSDKSAIIDQVMASLGLPDVTDFYDIPAVAEKATRDVRIDTKGFDSLTAEQIITDSCRQLNIDVAGRSIYDQSNRLLNNMNSQDRDTVANQLDSNESANTLS